MVIAHRGGWTEAPENSIEAMLISAANGADMVELDVQRTVTGRLYMMHDDTTDRMTNRSGLTTGVLDEDFDSLYLRQGAGGPDAPLTDIRVPSLRQTLEAARGLVHVNIDTKHRRDLEAVGDLVRETDMADQVLIKMSVDPADPDATIRQARWFDDLTFMPVLLNPRPETIAEDALAVTRFFDASMLEMSFNSLGELDAVSTALAPEGVRLWVNTLDDVHPVDFHDTRALSDPVGVWGALIDHGIGAIQTDQTAALTEFLNRST